MNVKYFLNLTPLPPKHPFVRVWFPVKVSLVDQRRQPKSGIALQLHVELFYEDGTLVPNQPKQLEVHGHDEARPILLTPTGSVDLKLRILSCSNAHEGKAFYLRFSGAPVPFNGQPQSQGVTIMPCTSAHLWVVRHRIRITQQPPSAWYKDEGGRDNCINISGLLVDEHEQPVQGREVPLKVVLAYEGEDTTEVKQQNILKIPQETLPKVDKFGKIILRVRIEEVSKNHQKQAFVVRIAPDTDYSSENGDISADITTPITVLSKRNKRRPKGGQDDDSPEGPVAMHGTGLTYQAPFLSLPPTSTVQPTAAAAGLHLARSTLPPTGRDAGLVQASSSTLPAITPTGASAKPQAGPGTIGRLGSTTETGQPTSEASEYKTGPSPNFTDTVSHLINWSTHVHDLLQRIEWQHVRFGTSTPGGIAASHLLMVQC